MDYNKLPGLSQKHMTDWLAEGLAPDSPMRTQGLIATIQPSFISCDFEKGTALFSIPVTEWSLNPLGVMHGGVAISAFDTALGILCHYYQQPYVLTTISIDTYFLKPVYAGSTLYVEAKINNLGRSLVTLSGKMWVEDETELTNICTAVFKVLHGKKRA